MPVEVEFNAPVFDETILDRFQEYVEQYTISTWLQSVSGGGPLGRSLRDTRYQNEVQSGSLIKRENSRGIRISVVTGGEIAALYESGQAPWDMKPGLLSGPNAKMGLNTRYNTVPFRHGVPRKGAAGGHFQTMPQEIYKIVRSNKPKHGGRVFVVQDAADKSKSFLVKKSKGGFKSHLTADMNSSVKTGIISRGHRLSGTGDFHRQGKVIFPKAGVQGQGHVKKYTWKTGKFEGLVKFSKQYDKGRGGQYMTFRRVSDRSDPSSWYHPGFARIPIMFLLSQYIDQKLPHLWASYISSLSQGAW